MNSEYGTKSPSELKELARRQMKKTTEVIPCVTVTEEHWRAMIELQKTQIALLESISESIPSLATRDEIADYMNQQITILTEYAEETKECTKVYQTDMQNTATETANRLTESAEKNIGTGWENEREIFTESILGAGYDEGVHKTPNENIAYTDSDTGGLGIGAAYLVADLTDIIDEDVYAEDCTTRHYAPNRKKKEQQSGPVMSGM